MELRTYDRKPETVKAIQIAIENIATISEKLQGDVVFGPGEIPFIRIDYISNPMIGVGVGKDLCIGDWVVVRGASRIEFFRDEEFKELFDPRQDDVSKLMFVTGRCQKCGDHIAVAHRPHHWKYCEG